MTVVALAVLVTGCGSQNGGILPDRKVDYKKQVVAENELEVPPDLTREGIGDALPLPGSASTYSQYASDRQGAPGVSAGASGVLPQLDNIKVLRDGNQRWLEIRATPEEVWPEVVSFWRQNGVLLLEQDPTVGVMKTDWLENRADIKQGFLTDFFRKALDSVYSAATRDQFRVRLEPGTEPGTTDLYLTHRGLEEQLVGTAGGQAETSYWAPRPSDPDLEAEMLRRIMLYLGVAEQRAGQSLAQAESAPRLRAELVKQSDGSAYLLLGTDFAPAWRQVGVALERVGFAVEDRDRSAGTYFVRYDDPTRSDDKGFFDKLAFWRDDKKFDDTQYRVRLVEKGDATRVAVYDAEDKPVLSDTGVRILTLIQEQIR